MKALAILFTWIILFPVSRVAAQDKSVVEMLQQVEKDKNEYFYDRNKVVATLTAIIASDPADRCHSSGKLKRPVMKEATLSSSGNKYTAFKADVAFRSA